MTTRLSDREIEAIARRIAGDLAVPEAGKPTGTVVQPGAVGLFPSVDEAVAAAHVAQPSFVALPLATRARIIAAIRVAMLAAAEELARTAHRETGLGRVSDKVVKNRLVTEKTPGLEDLEPVAVSGDHGLTLTEPAPFGVIGAITPCTNPTSTIICNTIGMVAAGNAVVFNAHPSARRCSLATVRALNAAAVAVGGPPNLVTAVGLPTIETATALMHHKGINLLVVTGGPGVVKAAMQSGKRAVCAGPGNPPAVVDETADLGKAGRDIVTGAGFDNNVICVDEKQCFVTAPAGDKLLEAMRAAGAYITSQTEMRRLEKHIFSEIRGPRTHGTINKDFVGKNPEVILATIGVKVGPEVRLVVADVQEDHPLVWSEQLMPVLPVVRVADVRRAIDLAKESEHGFGHSASMHSRDIEALSRMARVINTSIFVKNAPIVAGLGAGGEGFTSFTIASPTGEGLTTARSFSRQRRCVMVDHFRIV